MPSVWKWDGLMELRRELRGLPDRLVNEAFGIVRHHTENTYGVLMTRYGSVTGNLKRNVTAQTSRTQFAVTGWVRSRAKHAYLYEHGTTRARTLAGRGRYRAGTNRGRMPAANIFIPTAQRERNAMYDDFDTMLRREGLRVVRAA